MVNSLFILHFSSFICLGAKYAWNIEIILWR